MVCTFIAAYVLANLGFYRKYSACISLLEQINVQVVLNEMLNIIIIRARTEKTQNSHGFFGYSVKVIINSNF